MAIRHMIVGATLFSAGACYGEQMKRTVAAAYNGTTYPAVSVQYRKDGAYVNGQQILQHRIGGARCDWQELPQEQRTHLLYAEIRAQPALITNYVIEKLRKD